MREEKLRWRERERTHTLRFEILSFVSLALYPVFCVSGPGGGTLSTWRFVPFLPRVSREGHRTPLEGELIGRTLSLQTVQRDLPCREKPRAKSYFPSLWGSRGARLDQQRLQVKVVASRVLGLLEARS